jgi:NarL family two-component system response regulator LiaR
VLIADDHAVVRRGLLALLESEQGITVVGEAGDGREAVDLARRLRPDVVLMDLLMPEMDGVEATRSILAETPEARVLVLTSYGGDDELLPALAAGACGFLLKDTGPEDLVRALRQAAAGITVLGPGLARRLTTTPMTPTPGSGDRDRLPGEQLTHRETEVLRQLTQGLSNREIAERLGVGESTIRTHVASLLAKLCLHNRTQAALFALQSGLVELDDIRL